jgi:hypothetical protein
MSIKDFATKQITKYAKMCYEKPSDFWQKAAISTITVYHLCQIAIVAINPNTPKREKAFLIPQEAMDGVINLATFAVFAESFKRLGRLAVRKEFVKGFKKDKKLFAEEFATTTNLVGSLIAVNIASPIIRNKFGGNMQKRFVNHNDKKAQISSVKTIRPSFGMKI